MRIQVLAKIVELRHPCQNQPQGLKDGEIVNQRLLWGVLENDISCLGDTVRLLSLLGKKEEREKKEREKKEKEREKREKREKKEREKKEAEEREEKSERDHELSEDNLRRATENIQEMTDDHINKLNKIQDSKEKEILE